MLLSTGYSQSVLLFPLLPSIFNSCSHTFALRLEPVKTSQNGEYPDPCHKGGWSTFLLLCYQSQESIQLSVCRTSF